MKVVPCARIRIASIGLVAALLMVVAPTHPAQAQTNSLEVPSSSGATAPASEKATTGENGKAAKHRQPDHSESRKKKNSFMHKMRDKAMAKVQKLFGSKLEPRPEPKPESNVE
jgi:spermidine/putrescine-binding protein